MNSLPLSLEETFRRSEIMRQMRIAAIQEDTVTPDALGDRIASCVLSYVLARSGMGKESTAEVIARAETLLTELHSSHAPLPPTPCPAARQ